ncbi:hypothetical protein [Burkholderia pseudomallei]|uniref:hypothetical protein n=1 Tax=Burkholderia pseudomallei TaxID=28450 RepID=UPI00053137BE|nr:hypothetical protein [Burkholderia pseudomallei]KGR92888.1 hypothetical protein X948_5778 [Burkholderia pseudomallei MSHR5608]
MNTHASISRTKRLMMAITLFGMVGANAFSQQSVNPGDIIVERTITPRIAYRPVPKDQDPVAVRATTFPASSFDPTMATAVSDLDLTNAHGSSGIAPNGLAINAGMAAVTQVLTGDTASRGFSHVPTGGAASASGIGGMIAGSVTNTVAPLTSALGALK